MELGPGPGLHLHEADTDAVDKVEHLWSSKCKENTPEPGHLNKGCWQWNKGIESTLDRSVG